MKKFISFLILLTLSLSSVFAAELPFSDIEGHWAIDEIGKAYENGVTNGYDDGTFRPDDTVSRAEFMKMVTCALFENIPELEGAEHWAEKYYNFALEAYLYAMTGEVYDQISPAVMSAENYDLPIKRWEMAYIINCALVNYFDAGKVLYLFENNTKFNDKAAIFETYSNNVGNSVLNVAYCGIVFGDENGNFNASDSGTRAEAVTVINRLCGVAEKIRDEYDRLIKEYNDNYEKTIEKYEQNKITYTEEQIPAENTVVEFTLENGNKFEITLYPQHAPQTCANFVALVNAGFYDGLTFHRLIPGFVLQGGDPNGDGTGGSEHNITGEFSANNIINELSHEKGVVSMARAEHNNSASSQFFICFEDCTDLDGAYAAFGKVTKGMEHIEALQDVEVSSKTSAPVEPIVIKQATVKK